MAQTLGELIFDLVLNDAPFNAALKAAQARMDDFAKKMQSSTASFSNVFDSAQSSLNNLNQATGDYVRSRQQMERLELTAARESAAKSVEAFRQQGIEKQFLLKQQFSQKQALQQKDLLQERIVGASLLQEQKTRDQILVVQEKFAAAQRLAGWRAAEAQKRKELADTERRRTAQAKTEIAQRNKEAREAIRAQKDAERAVMALRRNNQQMLSDLGGLADKTASTIASAFKIAAASVAALVGGVTLLGARLENTLNKVAVVGGGGLDELTAAAKRFGTTTEFSAQESANAMLFFAQAGLTARQNIAATEASIRLAAAAQTDLTASNLVVSNTISQFGLTASDSSRIANVFTYALNKSKLNVEDLTVSMKYAGTVGAGFGMSLEETTAAIMKLADLGLAASKSGTVFRLAMTKAANATGEAERVLKKYGLTQADINPETKKFAGILDIVAESSMSVSDAMIVFGLQAGANIVQLARNQKAMQDGTRSGLTYTQMIKGMGDAIRTDLAGATAEKISQTVTRQFARLTASVQSLASDLYGTYSNQLLLLIKEFIAVSQTIADTFRYSANVVDTSFGGAILRLRDYIAANRTAIVAMVFDFVNGFQRVAVQLSTLIPIFLSVMKFTNDFIAGLINITDKILAIIPVADSAAQVLATVFIATRIVSFTAALLEVPAALAAVRWAARALGLEITALTGGVYAVVAAGGLLIAWLISLAGKSDEAAASVDRLALAQMRQRRASEAAFAKQVEDIGTLLRAQQERVTAEVESGAKLEAARKAEIQQILALTAEQALYEKQAGRLVIVNNELISASSAVAQIQSKSAGSAELLTAIQAQQNKEVSAARDELQRLAFAYSQVSRAVSVYDTAGKTGEDLNQKVAEISKSLGVQVDSFAELKLKVEAAQTAYAKAKDSAASFNNQMTAAKVAMSDAADAGLQAEASAQSAGSALQDMSKSAIAAAESTSELYNRIFGDLEKATQDQKTIRAKALEDQIAQDQQAYDQLIAQAKAAGQDTSALEFERIVAEGIRRDTAYAEAIKDAKSYYDAAAQQASEALRSESEKRSAARSKEIQELRDYYAALTAINIGNDERKQELQAQANAAEAALRTRYQAEDRERYRQAMDELNGILAEASADAQQIAKQQVQATMTEYERSIAEGTARVNELRAAAIAQIRAMEKEGKLSPEQVAVQLAAFEANFKSTADAIMQQAHQSGLGNWAETFIGKQLTRVLGKEGEAAVSKFISKFRKGLEGIKSTISGIRSVIGTLGGAFKSVMGVVTSVSGFSLDILSTIQGVVGDIYYTQLRAADEAARLASEAGFDPEAARQRAMEANDPRKLARGFVNELAQRAVDFANIFAQAIGPVLSTLAARLPEIITTVADAMPEIANALARNIGPIVSALADSIPVLVVAIIDQLPQIAMALIDAIIYDLIPKIPSIVFQIAKALVEAIFEYLKMYFTAIGEGIANAIARVFGIDPAERQARREDRQARREERRSNRAAYSGIDYVPATMRATLHQGEAVIPADRNMQRFKAAAPAPAGYAQNFGGGPNAAPSKVEVAVIAEGRLLEAVQLTAQSMGRANGMSKKIRRAAGVQVGFFRGQFNPFSV